MPQLPLPPPWHDNVRLQDGVPVSRQMQDTLAHMIGLMNNGSATLPDLRDSKGAAGAGKGAS